MLERRILNVGVIFFNILYIIIHNFLKYIMLYISYIILGVIFLSIPYTILYKIIIHQKFLIIFLKKIAEIHSCPTRQLSDSVFFYRKCQNQIPKTQFRIKVQRFGQN